MAATVLMVIGDAGFRAAAARVLRSSGYDVEMLSDPSILRRAPREQPTCVLLDLRTPGTREVALQADFACGGDAHPVVITSDNDDAQACVDAMKRGAIDVVMKSCKTQRLLEAIEGALRYDASQRRAKSVRDEARRRVSLLTKREREVLDGVMNGLLNKQIAADLGIAVSTVKVHRSRMMEKLGIDSVVALTHFFDIASSAPDCHDAPSELGELATRWTSVSASGERRRASIAPIESVPPPA